MWTAQVLDKISLSDHRYIRYIIRNQTPVTPKDPPQWNSRKVVTKKLEAILREATPDSDLTGCDADECEDSSHPVSRIPARP